MAYNYEADLQNLKNAQINAQRASLENTRNQTLSDLASEQQKGTAGFNAQRNTANVQNRLGARNFQEYLASTGRANSGIAAQANLMNKNNLNTQMNSIYGAENQFNNDIERQRTNANNAFNSGLAAATANAEANYIENLVKQRQAQQEFDENVRQFNEQMALERQKLYSNFSSGRGGSGGGSSADDDDDDGFTDSPASPTETTKKKSTTKNNTNNIAKAKNPIKSNTSSEIKELAKGVGKLYSNGIPFVRWYNVAKTANNLLKK